LASVSTILRVDGDVCRDWATSTASTIAVDLCFRDDLLALVDDSPTCRFDEATSIEERTSSKDRTATTPIAATAAPSRSAGPIDVVS